MLNFRKLKQGISSNMLRGGKELHDNQSVVSAKITYLTNDTMHVEGSVCGNYDKTYSCQLEIDLYDSEIIDSQCGCSQNYDCVHVVALILFMENNLNKLLVSFSKEGSLDEDIDEEEKRQLQSKLDEVTDKEAIVFEEKLRRELRNEYIESSKLLGESLFFTSMQEQLQDKAELAVILVTDTQQVFSALHLPEIQIALRLPYRSKPLYIPDIREFIEAVRYGEVLEMGGRRYYFTESSFGECSRVVMQSILSAIHFFEGGDKNESRVAQMDIEGLSGMLAAAYNWVSESSGKAASLSDEGELPAIPCLFYGALDEPLRYSTSGAKLSFTLDYLQEPLPKLFLKPGVIIEEQQYALEDLSILGGAEPGVLHDGVYHRFVSEVTRNHLHEVNRIREMTIPEPLFGSFIEHSLGELESCAEVMNKEVIEQFVTLPYVDPLSARCEISYLNQELDAALYFVYGSREIPAAPVKLEQGDMEHFLTEEGILARNLVEERDLINHLFQGFLYDETTGCYTAKTAKKIVEFMTETIPRYQSQVAFACPENLLEQFIYDDTVFYLSLRESKNIGFCEIELKIKGPLQGASLSALWDCVSARKAFLELDKPQATVKGKKKKSAAKKTLVLDLEVMTRVVQVFDELGLDRCDNYITERPLWTLVTFSGGMLEGLPIELEMTESLQTTQKRMIGASQAKAAPVPRVINAKLRSYQKEGVHWLERLRSMHLSGILADDMGLGKTLQAIIAITQYKKEKGQEPSLVICPTSLTYNWKEEIRKFNPKLSVLLIDGTPSNRKRLVEQIEGYDIVITSYSLLQKDIALYKEIAFGYCILDEAQHIKNRGTRNAKSVKQIMATHRLILTGTPIENSLDELWSLFDFLMPGLLSSYPRFVDKYIRTGIAVDGREQLQKKVSPFILRRMKEDVLKDLPPVSEVMYRCSLSPIQKELYASYAQEARKELTRLVEKEGFENVHIHVLATLTRLKQICCHPALFAKDGIDEGDSAKYDMLIELLETLISGGRKTVIFSQYTRMLQIMRQDLANRGIKYSYLDGSSKNRLDIVNAFNEDANTPIFLVSLKAGGTGLNLVGADTVIHYDMWWNPAIEAQATGRVYRMGQENSVLAYKLVTTGTIEEKIVELQKRKKGLVKEIVSGDEEVISKLTWEDVLCLLQE